MQWPTLLPALTCTWFSKSSNKKQPLILFLKGILLCTSSLSFAGDAAHKICIGTVSKETIKLSYEDRRGPDGEKRKYTLDIKQNGKNYSGTATSAEDIVAIKLKNKENESDVLFDGSFKPVENNRLELNGKPFSLVFECEELRK